MQNSVCPSRPWPMLNHVELLRRSKHCFLALFNTNPTYPDGVTSLLVDVILQGSCPMPARLQLQPRPALLRREMGILSTCKTPCLCQRP
eukprot:symbB.v1.2.012454.t1/scaffold858.1/size157433/2